MSTLEQLEPRRPLEARYRLASITKSLPDLWRHRHMIKHMTIQQLRSQYKHSVLGYAWAILNPLTQLLILAFIFSTIFHSPSEDVPFTLFLAVGLLPWIFFGNSVLSATDSIVANGHLIKAVYFPREVILISAVLVRVIDLIVGMLIVICLLVYTGHSLPWTIAWVPAIFLLQFFFVIGLSLPLSALNVFFHDVRFLVGVVLNLWFFLTPIFYSLTIVPERFRLLYEINPIARFIAAYRESVLSGNSPAAVDIGLLLLPTCCVLFGGYYVFKRLEPGFADQS